MHVCIWDNEMYADMGYIVKEYLVRLLDVIARLMEPYVWHVINEYKWMVIRIKDSWHIWIW